MLMNTSAIVTTKNESKNITRCLRSLLDVGFPRESIIVVDNFSDDDTAELAQVHAGTVVTHGPERCAQRNIGILRATTENVLILDADMEMQSGIIEECLRKLDAGYEAVIIPEESRALGFWARCRAFEKNAYLGDSRVEAPRLFRRTLLLRLGGYDENLFAFEDWDLRRRIESVTKIGRIEKRIIHWEPSGAAFSALAFKKRYYAQCARAFVSKWPDARRRELSLTRVSTLFRALPRDPIHAIGAFALKIADLASFCGVFLPSFGGLRHHKK